MIPKGKDGLDGENIPNKINAAYIVAFNKDYLDDGYEILKGERLPLQRKEIDTNNIVELDSNNNTIKFNKEGYYKGHTQNYILVEYKTDEELENKIVKVNIKKAEVEYVIG